MFQLSLNIGLLASSNGAVQSLANARSAAIKSFPEAIGAGAVYELAQSSTEPTLVLSLFVTNRLTLAEIDARVFSLSVQLDQDCIAWTYGTHGQLSGPRADAWGEFDHDFFLRPSVRMTDKAIVVQSSANHV